MRKSYNVVLILVLVCVALNQNTNGQQVGKSNSTSSLQQQSSLLTAPHYQADFTPIIGNGLHKVTWSKNYLTSFGSGEMKEPVTVYDKSGRQIFETWPKFAGAIKVYAQDAVATSNGEAVVAGSVLSSDGTAADFIAEIGPNGIGRTIRTTPFYPFKICVTDEGTVWAYGMELGSNRASEPRGRYPMLREYSFEKGELRTAIDRSTVRPPQGVPIIGARDDLYLHSIPGKVVLVNGPINEIEEYDLATSTLSRWAIAPLPDGFYITGAAVKQSGEVYISTFRPGQGATSGMLRLHLETAGTARWTALTTVPSGSQFFLLLGSDDKDLVYSRGRRSPALLWSKPMDTETAK